MAIRRPQHPERVLIVGVLVLAGISAAVLGIASQQDGPAEVKRPSAIVLLEPNEGQLVLPQNSVGVQTDPRYTVQLFVDGRLIPQDQMTGDPSLGIFNFDPGPGKEFRELPKGNNSAVVEWWPRDIPTPEEARAQSRLASYTWAFKVG